GRAAGDDAAGNPERAAEHRDDREGVDAGDDHVEPPGDPPDRSRLLPARGRLVRARRRLRLAPVLARARRGRAGVRRLLIRHSGALRRLVHGLGADTHGRGAEGHRDDAWRAGADDPRARERARAQAGQGILDRQLSAAAGHVVQGRRLRGRRRRARARPRLRRSLQRARGESHRRRHPARCREVLHARFVQPRGGGRAQAMKIALAALALTLAPALAAGAALTLDEAGTREAIRAGEKSVDNEAFDTEWRVNNDRGESVSVLTPFHRLVVAARHATFNGKPLKPSDPEKILKENRDRLVFLVELQGASENFARYYLPRLVVADREIQAAFVQNERTAS